MESTTFSDTTDEHTRLACRARCPRRAAILTSDLCPVSSPAALLFNLPFYRANNSLVMIGDLLRLVGVATFFADE